MKECNNPHPTTFWGAVCHMIMHGLLAIFVLFWLIVEYFHWIFQLFFIIIVVALLFQSFVGFVAIIINIRKKKPSSMQENKI